MPSSKTQPRSFDPDGGSLLSVRFISSLIMIAVGIAWIAVYYTQVWVAPGEEAGSLGSLTFMGDLDRWNFAVGFGLVFLGLIVAAHPTTPLGRGRGVVVGMLGCFLIGLAWIVTFYVFANQIDAVPLFDALGQFNLMVGIGFMAVGFAYATRWE